MDLGDFGFWISDLGDFGSWGFWILDFGPLCNKSFCGPKFRGFWISGILDFGDFGFWIRGILDFGDFGFWISDLGDFGFWNVGDFGFWILDRYVANLYVRPPTPQIWGISDFGFWGFWILGSLGILDFGFCDKFWILHKKKKKTVHAEPGRRIYKEKHS